MCLRERGSQACSKEGWCWVPCQAFAWIQGKSKLSFQLSKLFPGFSWACAGALPLSYLFPGFSGGFMPALFQSHPFPDLLRLVPPFFYGYHFGSYWECLTVLLVLWLALCIHSVKGIPSCCSLLPPALI